MENIGVLCLKIFRFEGDSFYIFEWACFRSPFKPELMRICSPEYHYENMPIQI